METDIKNITDIIVSGSIARDEIMSFPGLFADHIAKDRLRNLNVSFVVNRLVKELGGTGTNIAYNARLVTKKPIHLLGAVGKDGDDFFDFFKKYGIGTKGVSKHEDLYTATGKVITDAKQNQIWSFYYGALEKTREIRKEDTKGKRPVLILSATHRTPFLRMQAQAKKLKILYAYDPGMVLTWIRDKDLREGVEGATWMIGNEYEMTQIKKRLKIDIKQMLTAGKTIITTLGAKGVLYQSKEKTLGVAGYRVKKALDPTGAGDAWRGGFWGSLAEGKSIEDSLKTANALASFVVESYGTVNHKPTIKDITRRADTLDIKKITKEKRK
ncbi:MAG: PfkB family carbohydrate kinase [Nanoarchaeota archaeon]|nr:PfkB family carbohydrate kinase [Nanoarchaeota archaeon]